MGNRKRAKNSCMCNVGFARTPAGIWVCWSCLTPAVFMNNKRCHYCGAKADTKDHIIPKCLGGPNSQDNLVPACFECNNKKAASMPTCACEQCTSARLKYGIVSRTAHKTRKK